MKFKFYLFSLVIGLLMCSVNLLADEVSRESSTFTAISAVMDDYISYEAAQGTASTAPQVYDNQIRVYQNGGTFTVYAKNGAIITEIQLGSAMATTVTYSVDGGSASNKKTIQTNQNLIVSGISASDNVKFTCKGTDSKTRLYVKFLKVTYTVSSKTPVTLTWSAETATATIDAIDNEFPTLSKDPNDITGVTYSSSNESIATVNESTGEITLVSAGKTTITASYAGDNTYSSASSEYTLVVKPANKVAAGTYNIPLNNATWNTNYNGTVSSVSQNKFEVSAELYGLTITLNNGSSTNAYINDAQTRIYNGYTMTFTAPAGYEITDIAFTAADNTWAGEHTASKGTMTDNKTWTGSSSEVIMYFKGTCRAASVKVTYVKSVAVHSIAVKSNSFQTTYLEGEKLDLSGLTLIVTYEDDTQGEVTSGWTASPANGTKLTTSNTEVTFTYKGKTCTQAITVNEIPSHNVTWSVNGVENVVTYKEGIDIAFVDPTSNLIPKGYEFMGWSTSKITGEQSTAPEYVTSATMGKDNITYYALFGKFDESSGSGNFKLVEEEPGSWEGDYLIVAKDKYAMGVHYANKNADTYSLYTDVSNYYNSETKSITSNPTTDGFIYRFAKTSSTSYSIYSVSDDTYLGISSGTTKKGSKLRWNTENAENTCDWTITYKSEGTCYVRNVGSNTLYLKWNNNSGSYRFAVYNQTDQTDIQLFKKEKGSYSYCTSVNYLTWSGKGKSEITVFNTGNEVNKFKGQTAKASNGAIVTYSITGSGNATINENTGEVFVNVAGTYTVTASADDMDPISYTLNVVDPEINISDTQFSEENPTATFTSNGVNMGLLCEDPEILLVKEGNTISVDITKSCTITAYAYDEYENEFSKEFTVTYHEPQNYNVTWMVNGKQEKTQSVLEGTKVTNPTVEDIPGYVFTGWVTSPIVGSLDAEPEFFSGIMPADKITLYAVFATVKNPDENVMTSVTSTLSTGVYYILGRDKDYGSHNYYAVTGNVAKKKLLATNVTDAVTENDDDKTISLDISNDVVDNSNMRYFVTVDGNDVELKMLGANSPILLKNSGDPELTNQAGIGWVYSHSDSDKKTFYIQAKNTTRGLIIRENAVVKGYAWTNIGGKYQDEVIYNDAKFYFLRGGVLSGYRTSVETRELVGIEIKKEPKILYTVGSTFDPSGLVLTGTFKDVYGEITKEEIAYDEELFTFSPSLLTKYNTTGSQKVTITYKGQSTKLTIKVVNPGTILAKSVVGGSYTVQVASEQAVEVTTENKEISATQGETVTLTATPNNGYKASSNLFKVYANTIVDGNPVQVSLPLNKVADNQYTFTMPVNDAVEIVTTFQQLFAITSTDGSITAVVDKDGTTITEASLGSKVVLTPSDGNKLVYYVRSDDQLRVYVGKDADEKYSFSMPARDITVYSTRDNGAGDYTVSKNVLTFHKNNPTQDEVSSAIENSSPNIINLSLINISSTVVNDLSALLNGKNTLIYTVASSARPNVVVVKGSMNEESRTCANFVLTDLVDFGPYDKDFTAAKTSYSRSNTAGYNSVCLPFVIDYSEVTKVFGNDAQIYKFTGVEKVDGRATSLTFMPFDEGSINAGVPVLVNNAQGTNLWTVELTTGRDVTLNSTTSPGISSVLKGAFVKKTIGTGFYKLNSTGAYFLKTGASSVVSPFRFYLSLVNSPSAPQQLPMFRLGEDEETGIKILGDEKNSDRVYDLSGRSVEKVVAPGLYIVNGKKMLLK